MLLFLFESDSTLDFAMFRTVMWHAFGLNNDLAAEHTSSPHKVVESHPVLLCGSLAGDLYAPATRKKGRRRGQTGATCQARDKMAMDWKQRHGKGASQNLFG